jgi:hypothetical protein
MQLSDITNPQERKKLIVAIGLGVMAPTPPTLIPFRVWEYDLQLSNGQLKLPTKSRTPLWNNYVRSFSVPLFRRFPKRREISSFITKSPNQHRRLRQFRTQHRPRLRLYYWQESNPPTYLRARKISLWKPVVTSLLREFES